MFYIYVLSDLSPHDDVWQGWWAAVRDDDRMMVGWVPSAYVEPISEERAERVKNRQSNSHRSRDPVVSEQDLSPDSFTESISPYGLMTPGDGIRGFDWMPMVEGAKVGQRTMVSQGLLTETPIT